MLPSLGIKILSSNSSSFTSHRDIPVAKIPQPVYLIVFRWLYMNVWISNAKLKTNRLQLDWWVYPGRRAVILRLPRLCVRTPVLTLPIRATVLCCPSVLGSRGVLRDRREACFVYLLLSLICPSLGRPGIDPLGTRVSASPYLALFCVFDACRETVSLVRTVALSWLSSSICSTLAWRLYFWFLFFSNFWLSFPLCSKLAMRHYILFVQLHIPDCLLPCVQRLLGDSSVSLVRTIANSDCWNQQTRDLISAWKTSSHKDLFRTLIHSLVCWSAQALWASLCFRLECWKVLSHLNNYIVHIYPILLVNHQDPNIFKVCLSFLWSMDL